MAEGLLSVNRFLRLVSARYRKHGGMLGAEHKQLHDIYKRQPCHYQRDVFRWVCRQPWRCALPAVVNFKLPFQKKNGAQGELQHGFLCPHLVQGTYSPR